jgi:serine/threonine protein kinase
VKQSAHIHARVLLSGDLPARALLELTASVFSTSPPPTKLLKLDGPRRVLLISPATRAPFVLKSWPLTLTHRLRAIAGLSRPHTQHQGSDRLRRAGFSTAPTLGILQTPRAPWSHAAELWLLIPFIQGTSLLSALRDPAHTLHTHQGLTLARTLGQHIAHLTAAGLFNRDHKPSNLILSDLPATPPTLIDTAGIRHCEPSNLDAKARMLASLYIEPSGLQPSCPPRLSLCFAAAKAATDTQTQAKSLFRAARHIIQNHGDPRPRISPIP